MESNNRLEHTVLTEEMFEEAVSRFKKKNKKCYEFITKSGTMFKDAVFKIFKRIWQTEEIPSAWDLTTLVQIYKGAGAREKLENNRFIHSKTWMPKLFESIATNLQSSPGRYRSGLHHVFTALRISTS